MHIVKRDGSQEPVKFDKISKRISRQAKGLKNTDPNVVAQKVIQGVYDGVSSKELDGLSVEVAYSMSIQHPDYDKLALRLAISALHKDTPSSFSETINKLYNMVDSFGRKQPMIADDVYKTVKKHAHILDNAVDYERDYLFDYFGFKTLERSYLLKLNEWDDGKLTRRVIERPQHMWMRVAVGIHKDDIDAAIETYNMLSTFEATHATPTLFNSGTVKNQLSSCFLVSCEDSIVSIYDTLKECALISQHAGGIGLHIHDIRSKGSPIYGTGGVSNGIIPMLKVYHETARYVDQCFSGNSLIETNNGLKEISKIKPQKDKVKTSNNQFNTVLGKKEFNSKYNMITLESGNNSVSCTDKHILLCIRGVAHMNDRELKNKISTGFLEPEWVESGQITKNDVIIQVETCQN